MKPPDHLRRSDAHHPPGSAPSPPPASTHADVAASNASTSGRTDARVDPARESVQKRAAVALVGNPNTGKTALFNALTGYRRHAANYPGVTVDVGRGPLRGVTQPIDLLDLPGTYSLAAHSPDEMIVANLLSGRVEGQPQPALVLVVVDASNPVRNCYLLTQLLDFGRPLVVALNMVDVAAARGIHVDADQLSVRLGVPVVPVIATRPHTVAPLARVLESALGGCRPRPCVELPDALQQEVVALREAEPERLQNAGDALRVLVDRGGCAEEQFVARGGRRESVESARARLVDAGVDPGPAEVRARYAGIHRLLDGVVARHPRPPDRWSEKLDRVLTHRVGGALVLAVVLYGLFYLIYRGSVPLMTLVELACAWIGRQAAMSLPEGVIQSLVVDGLIGGVGGVLAFLPQILMLFMFIAILEDCGYLARAAFMVDRLMRPLGLSGRAFIPLLSAFACAVPAILGTRAIADRRERFITILIIPFMSCSARLPVYVLLVGAFVPATSWLGGWLRLDALTMLAMYLVGVVFAIPIAILLKRTVLTGPPAGFLLELPPYRFPRVHSVFQRMYLAGRSFVARAGSVILAVNMIVWALGYFPRSAETRAEVERQRVVTGWDERTFQSELAGAYLRESYLGQLGRAIEPALRPMGWDWRIGVGVLASFPAREVIIATLGTLLNLGGDGDEGSPALREAVQQMKREDTGEPLFSLPVALSLMVFFALCAQCSATLVVLGREMGSWVWPVVSFLGMTSLAYLAAWGTYAVASGLT